MAEIKEFKPIANFAVGDNITNVCYLLKETNVEKGRDGRPYLSGILADKDSEIVLRHWDYKGSIDANDSGTIVCVSGTVGEYKGKPQLVLNFIRKALPLDKYNEDELVPVADINVEKTTALVKRLLSSIADDELRKVCEAVYVKYEADFTSYPAAKSVHHAFKSGLLMHTASMMRVANGLSALYPIINRDLLLAGTFLHDIGKKFEYVLSPLGLVTDYSIEGNLLGHLVIGADVVRDACAELVVDPEKTMLLRHMLLSHHGEPEYGAAKRPATPEAYLLSEIDRMDSRMAIITEAISEVEPGKMSDPIGTLGGQRLYKTILEPVVPVNQKGATS